MTTDFFIFGVNLALDRTTEAQTLFLSGVLCHEQVPTFLNVSFQTNHFKTIINLVVFHHTLYVSRQKVSEISPPPPPPL